MHSFDFLHVNMTGTFWSCRDKMLYLKERPGYSVPAPLSLLIAELSPCCVHAHKIKHLLMKKSISYKLLNSMEYKNVQTNYNYLSNKNMYFVTASKVFIYMYLYLYMYNYVVFT